MFDFGGVCMLMVQMKSNYCVAHQYCESVSKETGLSLFMPGSNASRITNYLPAGSFAFTGISKLLNRTATDISAGWRYSDPGWSSAVTRPGDTIIQWDKSQTPLPAHTVGVVSSAGMKTSYQKNELVDYVFCELSNYVKNPITDPLLLNWPNGQNSVFIGDNLEAGCFDASTVLTLFDCCDT